MKKLFVRLVRDDEGQDLIEYGLLLGLITVGAVVTISLIGPKTKGFFDDLLAAIS